MMRRIALVALAVALSAAPARSQGEMRFSLFLNPFKYFMGLFNLGCELQWRSDFSICVDAEYIGLRSERLKGIAHPDIVGTIGFRYYPASNDRDAAGPFAGISSSCFYWKPGRHGVSAVDFSFGVEGGYKAPIGDSFYIAPRGLLNRTMRGERLLLGAEALSGMMP